MVIMPDSTQFQDTTALCSVLVAAIYQLERRVWKFRDVEGPDLRKWAEMVESVRAPKTDVCVILDNPRLWREAMDSYKPDASAEEKDILVDTLQQQMVALKDFDGYTKLDKGATHDLLGYMTALYDRLDKVGRQQQRALLKAGDDERSA